jgi:hypothetical protein
MFAAAAANDENSHRLEKEPEVVAMAQWAVQCFQEFLHNHRPPSRAAASGQRGGYSFALFCGP